MKKIKSIYVPCPEINRKYKEEIAKSNLVIQAVEEYFDDKYVKEGRKMSHQDNIHRSYAIYLCRKLTNTPINLLGSIFGCHHSTIVHHQKIIKGYLCHQNGLSDIVKEIENRYKIMSLTGESEDHSGVEVGL